MPPLASDWDRLLGKIAIWFALILAIFLFRLAVAAIRYQFARFRERRRVVRMESTMPPPRIEPRGEATTEDMVPKPQPKRKAVLRGVAGYYHGSEIPFDDKPIIIGRDPASANLVFPPDLRLISGRHCVIRRDGARFFLEDCGSTNGTFVASGKAIRPGEPKEVTPGERFFLGDKSTMFEIALL
jgi:hypothetical protein